jgi:hypothetical protein
LAGIDSIPLKKRLQTVDSRRSLVHNSALAVVGEKGPRDGVFPKWGAVLCHWLLQAARRRMFPFRGNMLFFVHWTRSLERESVLTQQVWLPGPICGNQQRFVALLSMASVENSSTTPTKD